MLRLALNAGVYPRPAGGEYATLNKVVGELSRQAVRRLLAAGYSVAMDATNLDRAERASWAQLARGAVPGVRGEIHWCAGRWDSALRWAVERRYTAQEYEEVRARLEARVQEPTADEADALFVYSPPGRGAAADSPAQLRCCHP